MRNEGLGDAVQSAPRRPEQHRHEDDEQDGHEEAVIEREPDRYGEGTESCETNPAGTDVSNVEDAGQEGRRNRHQVLERRGPPRKGRDQAERCTSDGDQAHAQPRPAEQAGQQMIEEEEGQPEQGHLKEKNQPPRIRNDRRDEVIDEVEPRNEVPEDRLLQETATESEPSKGFKVNEVVLPEVAP
jgi:hypothetical protein